MLTHRYFLLPPPPSLICLTITTYVHHLWVYEKLKKSQKYQAYEMGRQHRKWQSKLLSTGHQDDEKLKSTA